MSDVEGDRSGLGGGVMFVHEGSRVIVARDDFQFSAAVKSVEDDWVVVIVDGQGVEVPVRREEIVAVMVA